MCFVDKKYPASLSLRYSKIRNWKSKMESALAPWRDLSIVWFSLWMMLVVAIPGVVFFFALKYLRIFKHWLKTPLITAQVWALRIQYGTARASEKIVNVPITLHSKNAQVKTTARSLIDYLREG